MKIEILIYSYLAICASMIVFNIACIFIFKRNEIKLAHDSEKFEKIIQSQILAGQVDDEHRKYIVQKLRNEKYLMAFDKTIETLYIEQPEAIKAYFKQLTLAFVELTKFYSSKDEIKATYFPYVINKYRLFYGENIKTVNDAMFSLLRSKSVYCRENALYALYSMGNAEIIIKALRIIDSEESQHNPKLITDGLLSFEGKKDELDELLWKNFDKFSIPMKVVILDYFRFSGAYYPEKFLEFFKGKYDSEIQYSAIRYFGKYPYQPAYEYLYKYVKGEDMTWEYPAIAALSLASYQSLETVELLKSKLSDKNWYVRYNSSQALENMGLGYDDLKDIIDGPDKFASDIVKYRLDQKNMREKEMEKVNV